LIGTKRIVGRATASAIASASMKSLLLVFMYGFTYCPVSVAPHEPARAGHGLKNVILPQASMPIKWTCRFAVKCSSCFARTLLAHHNLAAQVESNQMKNCLAEINANRV